MKARLLAGCPEATLIDVSHSVPAFDVVAGAFVLWAGTRDFGPGAVHLAVVDPGVGTARRAVAVEVAGSWYVGPDNGLLGLVLADAPSPPAAVELRRPELASATFEGRDVFAPAAASLAAGMAPSALGRPVAGELAGLSLSGPAVLWVDRFGNLVTSLREAVAGVRVNGVEVRVRARTYAEAPPGTPFLYVGSMGFVELGVRQGRADVALGAGPGTPIAVLGAPAPLPPRA